MGLNLRKNGRLPFYLSTVIFILISYSSCGKSTTSSPNLISTVFPLGTQVNGVTLSGPLAGKTMYVLPQAINPSMCWNDSVKWTGSELFFGISDINWTELNGGGGVVIESSCSPQPGLSNPSAGFFNIYRGQVSNGSWALTSLPLNSGISTSQAAPTLSGNTFGFVKYEKTNSFGNIYLSNRTGDNTYSTPTAFANNSVNCNDDNPSIYASGTKMVFESNRTAPANNSACNTSGGSAVQTFWTSQFSGGSWSSPSPLIGAPSTVSHTVIQPWVEDLSGNLYWTANGNDCLGGPYTTCIKMAQPSGGNWSNSSIQIITPTPVSQLAAGDVALIGQFTQGNGYAFAVCGILQAGTGPHYFVSNLAVFFSICVIPL